jgi:hypothetical protein
VRSFFAKKKLQLSKCKKRGCIAENNGPNG